MVIKMQIEIKHISKSYGKKQVLTDVSLQLQGGCCVGILGANGTGKSTLLSILAGVQEQGSGEFLFDGVDLFQNPRKRSRLVGYVPQGTPLIEELTAWDNLLLWYDRKQLRQELENGILKLLDLQDVLKIPVRKLSGGMKKRLSFGCAMANKPPILLLDEPTAAIDLACQLSIHQYLKAYKKAGGVILMTTHDLQDLSLFDTLYILKDGSLRQYTHTPELQELVDSL